MRKTILLILLFSITACAGPLDIDKAISNGLIQASEDLKNNATMYESEVIQITKGNFSFEKAQMAKDKLMISIDFYRQSLAKNEEAIPLIKDEEKLKLRKFISAKTAKVIKCNEYGLELLDVVIEHGEMTLTSEMEKVMAKIDVCEEEKIKLNY